MSKTAPPSTNGRKRRTVKTKVPSAAEQHINTIAALERHALHERRPGEQLGDTLMARLGTMTMVMVHVVWFAVWIAINVGWVPFIPPFDPFPFGFLTTAVSLEAIVLSLFVLITQNRIVRQADMRAHLDLQINLLIETEVTETLRVLKRIADKVGVDLSGEPDLPELSATTDLRRLARDIEGKIPELKLHRRDK